MEEAALERAVGRVVAAQTALSLGFTSASASALDLLLSALERFLAETAHRSHEHAEACGRAAPALPDVLRALRDPELATDLPRLASYVAACKAGKAAEVPFAQPLPRYPLRRRPRNCPPSLREAGEDAKDLPACLAAAPPWVPVPPDAHTYRGEPRHSAAVHAKGAAAAPAVARRQLGAQTVDAEAALSSLSDKLTPGAPTNFSTAQPQRWGGEPGGEARAAQQASALVSVSISAEAANPLVRFAAERGGAPGFSFLTAGAAEPKQKPAALGAPAVGGEGWAAAPVEKALSGLPPVDSFALEPRLLARATAVAARGGGGGGFCFSELGGREGEGEAGERGEARKRAGERVGAILGRDPHDPEVLEQLGDIIGGR
jgi:hypothetical protein